MLPFVPPGVVQYFRVLPDPEYREGGMTRKRLEETHRDAPSGKIVEHWGGRIA
jgi:hypothetical protein